MGNVFIGIDPSINDVGWAKLEGDNLVDFGTIKSKGKTDGEKLCSIRHTIRETFYPIEESIVIIEKPPPFTYTRSTSKWTGRGLNAEAIQKLNMAYGVILEAFYDFPEEYPCKVLTPTPQEYKGRISPEQVKMNMEAVFKKKFNVHEAHAVMMARHYAILAKLLRIENLK